MEAESWYLQNKSKIMRQVRFALPHFRKHFVEAYGKEEGEAIAGETAAETAMPKATMAVRICDFIMGSPVRGLSVYPAVTA